LPKFSSTEYFENFTKSPKKEFEDEDFSDDFDNLLDEAEKEGSESAENDQIDYSHDLEFVAQDDISFDLDIEPGAPEDLDDLIDQKECLDLEDGKQPEFDKLNIPRPPDKKAEYFLSLIETEFDEIRKRAQKFLDHVQKEKQIPQFAKENIQKAKKLAVDSGHLGKLLKPEDSDTLSDSDAYIIHVLGLFLIRSISFYQGLFEPFLKIPQDSEDELRAYVDNPYVFSHKGDFWKIHFNGEETFIKDLERIRYIAHLLDNPNKDFFCHELTTLVKRNSNELSDLKMIHGIDPIESDNQEKKDQKINFVIPYESGLDQEDLYAIKKVAKKLWEKLNDPDLIDNERNEAKNNWEKAKLVYLNQYGISLKSSEKGPILTENRRLKEDFEKARSNVTKHIKNAIKNIRKKIPSLSAHLDNTIRTGAKCCYQPDPTNPIKWRILWNN
jgi:hypothetical protein